MTERKLEASERKSHEVVLKWDDDPLFSHVPCSSTHTNEITGQEHDKDIFSANFSCHSDDINNLPKLESEVMKDAIPVYENIPENTSKSNKDILSAKFFCSIGDNINIPKLEGEVIKDVIPVYENIPENESSETDKDILSSYFSCLSDDIINVPKLKNEVIQVYENIAENTLSENNKVILPSNVSCSSNDIINILQSESGDIHFFNPNSENIIESTSPSANQYHSNLHKNTESGNVIQGKINEDEKSFSSIEMEDLGTCIYAGGKEKYENRDHDLATEFHINSGVSDGDIRTFLRNENDELKQRAGSTEKILGEKFPLNPDYTAINKSNMIENGLKGSMTEEQSTEYPGLLYPEGVACLLASKNKIIKQKCEKAEGIVSTEVGISENSITTMDYNRLQYDHTSTDKSTFKKKVEENTLNVLHEEYDKSFQSHTYCSNASFHIKEKMNSEKTEKIFYDHMNYKTDFSCTDSGNSVGENLIFHDANDSENFYCINPSDLNSVKIADVKYDGLYHSPDCTVSQTDKRDLAMAANKKTEPIVLCDKGSLEDLSDYTSIYYDKDQDMQHKVKTEVIGKSYECEKSNDGLLSNEDLDYSAPLCYLTDKKKSFEKKDNFYTSWHETFSNCVSSLTKLNVFGNCTKYIIGTQNKTIIEKAEANRNYEDMNSTNFNHSPNNVREIPNEKCNSAKNVDTRETLISQSCESRSQDIKTLEGALNYFDLTNLMDELEVSLEEVRRRRKTKESHELLLKDVDKQIQKLSFKYHPDRVRNKDGSDEEIETAQKLQAAINAVRSALNVLNDAFLEDLYTDHRYGFYTKLELSSLANENEVKNHIYEVIFQIGLLSEIKQQKVIVEIQKFVFESERCIQSYFAHNVCDFEKHRDLALLHLKCCIKGYKKLKSELEVIEIECKAEKLDNIGCSISRMIIENQKMLTVLRDVKRVAKKSLAGSFQIFTTSETLDEYFVLPFVCYVNVILMCNVMIQSEVGRLRDNVLKSSHNHCQSFKINGNISFVLLYSLVLYFIDNGRCEWLFKENMDKNESKEEFDRHLVCLTIYFKDTFKVCDYTYDRLRNYISEELKKCMKMMFDFKVKEKELSEKIEKIEKKTGKIDKKYERIMKENEEINKLTQQQIENSIKLSELTSLATSEKF